MNAQTLFYLAFAAQILILSVYIPRKIAEQMRFVFDNYPAEKYPRLYPKSMDYYELRRSSYSRVNVVIALVGVAILAGMLFVTHEYDIDNSLALAYFLLQAAPLIWLDISLRNELKLMRQLDSRTTRTANLNPRRLFDVMSPKLFWAVVVVWLGFWVLVAWFRQFDYPWFGGFANNLILTGMNLVFATLLGWRMYGKKLDPHLSDDDRVQQLRTLAWILAVVSIAATLFAVLTISLSAADAKEFRPFAVSIYYQLIALASLKAYRIDKLDFDVYRDDPITT